MTENEKAEDNPILKWLKKFKVIYWALAFLAVFGGAIKFGGEMFDATEKFVKHWTDHKEEETKKAVLNDQLGQLAWAVVRLATRKTYPWLMEIWPDDTAARRQILISTAAFHLPPAFKDVDYSEPKPGEMSDQVTTLASALVAATNDIEVGKTFLYTYWVMRAWWDISLAATGKVKGVGLSNFIPQINGNRPQGVEPFQRGKFPLTEYCLYVLKHLPFSILDDPREKEKVDCNELNLLERLTTRPPN